MKFYKCSECNQVFLSLIDQEQPVTCCKQNMEEVEVLHEGEDYEKHKPTIRKIGNFVTITVGKGHPMIDVHHISYIFIETNQGFMYKDLKGKDIAKAEFILAKGEEIVNIYTYCNVHMLWSLH